MEYKFLGKTGVKVSELCMGTMSFGGEADEKASAEMFRFCRDRGINFFDSANVYNGGRSEEILGKLIKNIRSEVVITSKVYFATGNDINASGGTRKHMRHALEDSLRRLGTDYIDIYFLHRYDDVTPLEETLGVLDDFVREGKILYPGSSNFSAWQTEKALGIAEKRNISRFECIQPMYNLVKRQAEVELFPMAMEENLGVFPYSPLGGGLLTGKYIPAKRPDSGRLVENKIYGVRYGAEWMYETAERFTTLAQERGVSPVSLAVSWVASHPAVTAPIIGARDLEQLKPSVASVDVDMGEELREEISLLSPAPPSATDRNDEESSFSFGIRR